MPANQPLKRRAMPLLRLIGLIGCLLLSDACTQAPPPPANPNPMAELWRGITARIDAMERAHAGEATWRENSNSAKVIRTAAELAAACPEEYRGREWHSAFARSTKVIRFGFDCDFRSIVFFDATGRSWRVIKCSL